MNIQDIRKQYPQYNDLSDQDLAAGFHKKFYSDLPFEDFAGRIGLGTMPPVPAPVSAESPAEAVKRVASTPVAGDMAGTFDMFGQQVAAAPAVTEPTPTEAPDISGGFFGDVGRQFLGPIVSGVADIPKGTLEAAGAIPRKVLTGEIMEEGPIGPRLLTKAIELIRSTFGTSLGKQEEEKLARKIAVDESLMDVNSLFELPKAAEYLSGLGKETRKKIEAGISPEGAAAIKGFEPTGNILEAIKTGDFSQLSLGEDPTWRGLALRTSEVLGSLAPVIASAIITKSPKVGGAVGGGMAAGEAADTAKEFIASKSDQELMTDSPYYAQLRRSGITEQNARQIITNRASEQAALLQGTVATFGGVFTGKLVTGQFDKYLTPYLKNRLVRIAGMGAIGALEEGGQEFLEGIAADLGINREVVREIGTDSFANAILGMLGGGPVGAVRGAISPKGGRTKEDDLIDVLNKNLPDNFGVDETASEVDTNTFNALYNVAKRQLGREPTVAELERLLDAYGQRTITTPDATGRIEPSFQVPSEPTAAPGVAEEPAGVEPGAVAVPSVPTGGVEAGAAPTVSPLNRLFAPSDTVSSQQKQTNIHYNTLMTDPANSVTQSLMGLDVALQKAQDAYAQIAARLNIPSAQEMMGLGVRLPKPLADLINYQSATGSASRLVNASKDLTAKNKRGSPEKVASALQQVQEDTAVVDNLIDKALTAAEDPAVQAEIDRLNEQKAVNAEVAARQDEIAAVPMDKRAAKIKEIEDEARAKLRPTEPTPAPTEPITPVEPLALPEGMTDAQFLDAATKLRAGNVMAVPFARLKPLKDSGLVLADNSLSPEGEALLDALAAVSKPADLRPSGETIKAKPGANARRLSKLLGPKLYGEPREMPFVSVKEMVQNAFDAIKPMQEKGQLVKGQIDINVDKATRIISVLDNGTGMSPETLSTTFLTIAGTKKEGERDSGGLGIAKMQFLFNNNRITVVTYRDGVLSVLESTGSELEEAMDDPNLAPNIRVFKGNDIPPQYFEMFPDGHGTYAEVAVPETYTDTGTGQEKPIAIEDYKSSYPVLAKSPLFSDIDVRFNGDTVRIGSNFPYNEYTQFADVNFDWGTARIYVEKKIDRYVFRNNAHILSNGLWQFDNSISVGTGFNAPIVRRNFYIDVSPKKGVRPEDANYPFDLNRQRFSPSVEESFNKIFNYMSFIYGAVDLANEAKNFGEVQYLDVRDGKVEATPPQELAPKADPSAVGVVSAISEGDVIEVKEGKLIVKGRVIPELSPNDLDNKQLNLDEFKIPQTQINANRVMLHDNVGLADSTANQKLEEELDRLLNDYIKDKLTTSEYQTKRDALEAKIDTQKRNPKLESLVALARKKFGKRFDEFVYEVGAEFVTLRNYVADLMNYPDLRNEAVGVSFDVEYRGVSIRIPFAGLFINPAVTESVEPRFAAAGVLGTMVHELAHHKVRSHNADFPAEMQRILYTMEGEALAGDTTLADIRQRLFKAFRDYKDVFDYIREVNTNANAKPRGKRFQDASTYEGRDERGARLMEESGRTTEREPGVPRTAEPSPPDVAEERERARFSGETAPGSIEDQVLKRITRALRITPAVADEIAKGNLKRALEVLSSRLTNPLYKELAARLAELNLPTTIVFNGARDLTRRQIDLKTYDQQKRLFNYIRITYPELYDKSFTNFDREENLEKVYSGIKALQSGKYNLEPVIVEFTDVKKAFDDNMRGLEVAGAYYPAFDTITLDLERATHDTFLHEVLHAATEAILEADLETLTEGQRIARARLEEMYQYAVENIPLDLYGLTDIHEFISELFSNKEFQDRLRKIRYKPTNTPFFTRLIRAIFQMVGFDNLAGNAMTQAVQLFSAVRARTPTTAGARFAPKGKRVRGPASTKSWRTAEQAGTNLIKEMERAIKGHATWSEMLPKISGAMWDAGNTVFRKRILGFANLRIIDDLTKTKFPQISGAIRIIEQMIADRNRTMTKAADTLKEWTRAQARKPGQSRLMGRIMLEATIRGIDPDTAPAGSLNPAFEAAWNGLDPEFKAIYRKVRDFYADSINTMIREMKQRALQLPKAERQEVLKEINRKFGPDKLVKPYFPLRRFGSYWFQVGKGEFKEFYEFESALARELAFQNRKEELENGNAQQRDLAETMRKGNGISELYNQNVSSTQVLKDAQDLIDNVTATDVANVKKELKESLDQLIYILLPQQSMRKMFINRQSIQGASEDMIRVFGATAVHTAYQQSRFKYAEKFINNLLTAKEYVKELPNADVYNDYIQEVEKRAATILSNEDTSMAAVVAGKLSEAAFYFMLSAPFSAMLNVLGFAQFTIPYIGGRYGYTKANGVILKNMGRYLATLPKRSISPVFKGQIMQMEFPSIVEGGNLDPLMQKAANRFIDDNDINISQTNDIMDIGGRPSELYTGRYNTLKRAIAALFHQSERLNREVTLLSVFELAYEKYLNEPNKNLRGVIQRDNAGNPIKNTPDEAFELAVVEAKDIAGLSLGDFTRQMKPRYFTSPALSVISKFKQYSVLATYATIRNFYFTFAAPFRNSEIEEFRQQMIKDKIPQDIIDQRIAEADAQRVATYKEGRRRLAGILGITYLLGGATSMPFYTLGLGTLVKLLANEDDDEFFDWENWFKNYMEVELGGYVADIYMKMGVESEKARKAGRATMEGVVRGPASVATGGSLSERVSIDPINLWIRDPRFSSDTRETVIEGVIANLGPVAGLTVNWAEAIELMEQGQYQRAFEKAAPAIVAKPAAAYRLAKEGAKTRSGVTLVDEFSAWEIAIQSIGLQPERLAQKQKAAIEAKTYEQKVTDRRSTLMNRLWMERGNDSAYSDVLERVVKFNQKYPEYAIEPSDIVESFTRRGQSQMEADMFGAQIQKKLRPRISPMLEYGRE
jgi:hypothetical protein